MLGIHDFNMMNIIHINCNTIDTQATDRGNNYRKNTTICQNSSHEQHYTNIMQEAERVEKCYANTHSISKIDNKDTSIVIDKKLNTINYFLPGPNQDNDKE